MNWKDNVLWVSVRQDATVSRFVSYAAGETPREEMGQETKPKKKEREHKHALLTAVIQRFFSYPYKEYKYNKLLRLDFPLDEKREITLTWDESDTVVSCVLYIPIGISQVVEQSFWYNLPYVLIHMSSFVIRICNYHYHDWWQSITNIKLNRFFL